MSKLVRQVTRDEIAAYRIAGVVLLRGILDLGAVNTLRRCIDEAVTTMGQSPSGYDLSALTKAIEADDQAVLAAKSEGQHDVAGIVQYMKASGKPLLFDPATGSKGSFLLDTGIAARLRERPGERRNGQVQRLDAVSTRKRHAATSRSVPSSSWPARRTCW